MRLDGSTAVQERQAMIDDFNKDVGIKVQMCSGSEEGSYVRLIDFRIKV